jgi:hypothetical protein
MRRFGGLWLACCFCGLLAGNPAVAVRMSGRADQPLVRVLVRTIRQDAHEQARRQKRLVTVTRTCCGNRTLRVYYRVPGGQHARRDAYLLRLETTHDLVDAIAVSESLSEEEHTTGIVRRESSFEYLLARLPGRREMSAAVRFSAGGSVENGPKQPSMGDSFSTECHPVGHAPGAFYREMLTILTNIRHHASSVARVDPRRYC